MALSGVPNFSKVQEQREKQQQKDRSKRDKLKDNKIFSIGDKVWLQDQSLGKDKGKWSIMATVEKPRVPQRVDHSGQPCPIRKKI